MNKKMLFLSTLLLMSGVNAFGVDLNEKIYGKANVKIGYSIEKVRGDVLLENTIEREFGQLFDMDLGNKDYLHNLDFALGYDFYFKADNLVHPFIGVEFDVRAPLKVNTRTLTKQKNYFSADIKAGVRFNKIANNISLQPYGVFGYALLERYNINWMGTTENRAEKVNALNYGAGIDVIYDINDKIGIIGGIEYKRVKALDKTKYTNFVLETDQIELKFGVQFL